MIVFPALHACLAIISFFLTSTLHIAFGPSVGFFALASRDTGNPAFDTANIELESGVCGVREGLGFDQWLGCVSSAEHFFKVHQTKFSLPMYDHFIGLFC